jgi:hypothetical protein
MAYSVIVDMEDKSFMSTVICVMRRMPWAVANGSVKNLRCCQPSACHVAHLTSYSRREARRFSEALLALCLIRQSSVQSPQQHHHRQ